MKILVANKDRTEDLGADIRKSAQVRMRGGEREVPDRIAPDISALSLARPKSEADYLNNLIRLIRYRDAVDTHDFAIPRKSGLSGMILIRIKSFLWKLLRYQHNRIAFRQNLINGLCTSALEFEIALRQKTMADLDQRLQRLESRLPPEKPS